MSDKRYTDADPLMAQLSMPIQERFNTDHSPVDLIKTLKTNSHYAFKRTNRHRSLGFFGFEPKSYQQALIDYVNAPSGPESVVRIFGVSPKELVNDIRDNLGLAPLKVIRPRSFSVDSMTLAGDNYATKNNRSSNGDDIHRVFNDEPIFRG